MNATADVAVNLVRARRAIRRAAEAGATLAVLPENFACMPASSRDRRRVFERDGTGPMQDFLAATSARFGIWLIGGTVPIRVDDSRASAAVLVYDSEGHRQARYDKMHLFDVHVAERNERYCESRHFAPGDRAVAVDTPLGRMGLAVCYDLRFPELFRYLALREGCTLFAVPSAFTASTGAAHWRTLLTARAIENQCFLLAAAQTGRHDDGRETHGESMIVGPWGEKLAALKRRPGTAIAELDTAAQRNLRRRFPVLDHARFFQGKT
ncbi:MAG: carbon-nitrogen hydrolase family protein [Gammaproteobacteria bacterium]|nr:carbon-nitrogen hydrolase family protein [Gammaproteobacteria bacterium]